MAYKLHFRSRFSFALPMSLMAGTLIPISVGASFERESTSGWLARKFSFVVGNCQ